MISILAEEAAEAFTFDWKHGAILVGAAVVVAVIGWLRSWAKSKWGDKLGGVIDLAVDAAENWAKKQLSEGKAKPSGDQKLAFAVNHAQGLLKGAPEKMKTTLSVIKALEGSLAVKKNAEDVVGTVTALIRDLKSKE